ncbi:hypothetical protein NU219Hw_g3530t1 [Hortaea werneckii]
MSAKRSSPPSSASSASSNTSEKLRSLQHEAENASDYEELSPLKIGLHGPISHSKASQQLAKWRKTSHRSATPRRYLEDSDFPAVVVNGAEVAPRKSKLNRWEAHQLRQVQVRNEEGELIPASVRSSDGEKEKEEQFTTSNMGLLARLPGEMRNVIYRHALVEPGDPLTDDSPPRRPVRLSGSDLICGRGPCVHGRLGGAAPGIASTCRQIRKEVMGIWVGENEFLFDAVMVRNRCAGNWVKALGRYADLLKKVRLEIQVLVRPPSGAQGQWTKEERVEIGVELPAGREDGRFEMKVEGKVPSKGKGEEKGLREKVDCLNDGDEGVQGQAANLAVLLYSEELAELVFKCRK